MWESFWASVCCSWLYLLICYRKKIEGIPCPVKPTAQLGPKREIKCIPRSENSSRKIKPKPSLYIACLLKNCQLLRDVAFANCFVLTTLELMAGLLL